jgi:hypothetical protein
MSSARSLSRCEPDAGPGLDLSASACQFVEGSTSAVDGKLRQHIDGACAGETFLVVCACGRHNLDVVGCSFGAVELSCEAADDHVLDLVAIQHLDDPWRIEI